MEGPADLGGARPSFETRRERRSASEAFAVGMAFNLGSLAIGNYYVVALLAVLLAGFAGLRWSRSRLAWIALGSTLAGNPVNPSASVACNVLVAAVFLLVSRRQVNRVPRWLYGVTVLALLSVLGSAFFWSAGIAPEALFTQIAAVANYILAPFFLVPVLYVGVGELDDPGYLATRLVAWLVAPTLLILALARAIGTPVVDPLAGQYEYELFAVYRLWNVDVVLTRTQVGIVLAALSCAAFALVLSGVRRRTRWLAGGCLATSAVLTLLTGSVGSVIAALAGMLAIIVVAARRVKGGRYLAVGGAVAIAVAIAWTVLPPEIREYAGSRYDERFTAGSGIGASDRTQIWALAAGYALENPNGVGWSLYLPPLGIFSHNDYLAYAIAYGVLCGALYAYVAARVWVTFAAGGRLKKDEPQFALGMAGLGVATVLIVNSMADHLTANRWYYNVVWSIIWFCFFATVPSGFASRRREAR